MKLLVLLLQAVSVTALPLNAASPPSEARVDAVSQHASPLIPPENSYPHHRQTDALSSPQKRDTHPHLTQEELCHVLAQLFAIQVQVAVLLPTLLVPAPSPSGILDNLLGGLFGVLPTLSQAIDLVIPTLDNFISSADQVLALPIVYTIPAFTPIITTTTINVPLSIIYNPFPTIGPSLTADLLALAQLTDPVAILDVVADLVASVLSPLLGGAILPVLVPVYPVLGVVPVLVTTVVTQTDGGTASLTVTKVEPLPTDVTGRVAPITALIPGLLPGAARPTGLNVGVSAVAGGGPGGVTLAAPVQLPGGLGLDLGVTVALPNIVPTRRPSAVTRGGPAAGTGQPGQPAASIALPTIPPVAMPAASPPSSPGLPLPTLPPAVSLPSRPTPSVALPTLPAVSAPPPAVPDIVLPTLPAVSISSVALPSVAIPRVSLAVPGVSPPTLPGLPSLPDPSVAPPAPPGLSLPPPPSLPIPPAISPPRISPPPLAVPDIVPPTLPAASIPPAVLPSVSVPGVSRPTLPGLPPLMVPAVAVSPSLGVSVPSLAAAAPARISSSPAAEVAGEQEVLIPTAPGRVVPTLPALPIIPTLSVIPALPELPTLPGIPAALVPFLPPQQASIAPLSLPTASGLLVPSLAPPDLPLPTLLAGLPGVAAPSLALPLDISNPTLPALPVPPLTGLPRVPGPRLPSLTLPAVPGASRLALPGISSRSGSGRPERQVSPSTPQLSLPRVSPPTGLPTGFVTGLAVVSLGAPLLPPTGRPAAGVPASSTIPLEGAVVLVTGRPQVSNPGFPQTSPGEVVPPTGPLPISLAGVLRPTSLPQNLPGPGQLSISGDSVQPTQPPPVPLEVPPPAGLPRASLAGALHATTPPEASLPQLLLSRPAASSHDIQGLTSPGASLPSGQSQPCTVPPQICTAQSQDAPPPTPPPANVLPVPCTRRCVVNPTPTVVLVPVPAPLPVVDADGPHPVQGLHDGSSPLPLQGDKIDASGGHNKGKVDNDASSVDDSDASPLLPDAPDASNALSHSSASTARPVPVPTGVVIYVSSSPPRFLSCFSRPVAALLFSLVIRGVVW